MHAFADLTNSGPFGRGYLYNGPASYDQDVFDYDELNRGTITLGEALTANAGTAVAPDFKGPVHLVSQLMPDQKYGTLTFFLLPFFA